MIQEVSFIQKPTWKGLRVSRHQALLLDFSVITYIIKLSATDRRTQKRYEIFYTLHMEK